MHQISPYRNYYIFYCTKLGLPSLYPIMLLQYDIILALFQKKKVIKTFVLPQEPGEFHAITHQSFFILHYKNPIQPVMPYKTHSYLFKQQSTLRINTYTNATLTTFHSFSLSRSHYLNILISLYNKSCQ